MLPRIIAEIAQNQGWISFARYMELALHAPGGYYAGSARKFGAEGDFVTAPELGRLFGRTLARQLKALLGDDETRSILEIGAGSGALAQTLLEELSCPYFILETSADLRDRQRARLGDRVSWLDALPQRFRGVIVANEVLDAMPVHAVAWRAQGIMERGVAADGDRLLWKDRPASGVLLQEAKKITPPIPYESEIGLAGQAWLRSLAERLEQGAIFVIDYGFPRHEYYHPQRAAGTLMCHHRHRAHGDVFARPGAEDLTAHVDFSALAEAARDAGLDVLGYATQAQFLVNCGITDVLGEANVENALHYAPLAAEANKLLSPAEMGELFKVLAVGPGVKKPLLGFTHNDRSPTL
jgi:SAM-dependent MidA family methyltransferase